MSNGRISVRERERSLKRTIKEQQTIIVSRVVSGRYQIISSITVKIAPSYPMRSNHVAGCANHLINTQLLKWTETLDF